MEADATRQSQGGADTLTADQSGGEVALPPARLFPLGFLEVSALVTSVGAGMRFHVSSVTHNIDCKGSGHSMCLYYKHSDPSFMEE